MTERPTLNGGSGWALNPECFYLNLPYLTLDKFEVGRLRESLSSLVSLFALGTGNKMIFLCSEQELRGQKWNKSTLIF